MGLVYRVCAPGGLLSDALLLANRLAEMSGTALGAIKQIIRGASSGSSSALDTASLEAMVNCFSTSEFKKGLADFFAKKGLFARDGRTSG
jgi:enoyl-CoA hydratase/carnithine racemase